VCKFCVGMAGSQEGSGNHINGEIWEFYYVLDGGNRLWRECGEKGSDDDDK